MSHDIKSILTVCDQLIHKPTNVFSKNHNQHIHTISTNADSSKEEYAADLKTTLFYTNTKHKLSVHLYKILTDGYSFNDVTDYATRDVLTSYPDVVREHQTHCRVPMHPGDVSIFFDRSALADEVNINHSFLTYGALIKNIGEKCFVTGTFSDLHSDKRLLMATTDDVEKILSYLESLL